MGGVGKPGRLASVARRVTSPCALDYIAEDTASELLSQNFIRDLSDKLSVIFPISLSRA